MIGKRALHVVMGSTVVAAGAIAVACGIDAVGRATDVAVPDGMALDARTEQDSAGDTVDAGADAAPGDRCSATGGPEMVYVDAGFCIDVTEVTNAQYAPFYASLDGGADAGDVPVSCAWKTSYRPSTWSTTPPYFPPGRPNVPVHAVDYCDAWMFCRWAGKRLCGALDGTPTPPAEVADAQASAWTFACSAGGKQPYPYGPAYQANACNTEKGGPAEPAEARAFPGCQGGYAGIFDMSGNAWEWDDSCEPGGASATCHVRGGSLTRGEADVRCTTALGTPRDDNTGNNGIRCCKY